MLRMDMQVLDDLGRVAVALLKTCVFSDGNRTIDLSRFNGCFAHGGRRRIVYSAPKICICKRAGQPFVNSIVVCCSAAVVADDGALQHGKPVR